MNFLNRKTFFLFFLFSKIIYNPIQAKELVFKNQLQRLNLKLKEDLLINSYNFKYKLKEKKIYTKGATHIKIGDYKFESNSSTIDLKTKMLIFKDGVKLTASNSTLKCKILHFQLKEKNWQCYQAELVTEKQRFIGKKITKNNKQYQIDDASFTSCKTCKKDSPDWSLHSKEIIIKKNRSYIKTPFIKIKKFSILALPYLSFPVNTNRAAGLLVPKISFSESLGWSYSQSLFLPFNINNDLTINETLYSNNIFKSSLEYRHIFKKNKHLEFYISHLWKTKKEIHYAGLAYKHYLKYGNNWTNRLNLQFISHSKYLQDFHNEDDPILRNYGETSLESKIALTKSLQKENFIQHFNIEGVLYQSILHSELPFNKSLTYSLPNAQYFLLTNRNFFKSLSTSLNINFDNFNTNRNGFIKSQLLNGQRFIGPDPSALFDPKTDIITSGKRLYIKPNISLNLQPNNIIKTNLQLSYNQFLYNFNPKTLKTDTSEYKNSAHQSYVNLNYFIKSNLYKIFSHKGNKYKHNIEPSLEVSYTPLTFKSDHNFFQKQSTPKNNTFNDNYFFNPDHKIQFDYYDNLEKYNTLNFKIYTQLIKKHNEKYDPLLDLKISQAYTLNNDNDYLAEELLTEMNLTVDQLGIFSKASYNHHNKLLSTSNHLYWFSKNKNYKIDINYSNTFFTGTKNKISVDKQENLQLSSLVSTHNWALSGSVDLFKKLNQVREIQSWDYKIFFQPDNQCWKISFQQEVKLKQSSNYYLNFSLDI